MVNNREYSEYLQQRSIIGKWYRKYWLYPYLTKQVSGKVLDIGCGIGDFLDYRSGTIGVDINPINVEFCKKRGLNVTLMLKDKLPFDPSTFQFILLDNVIEHIQNPHPLLKEIRRVLKNDGTLIIGVPGVKGYTKDPDHKHFYDKSTLKECLSENQFHQLDLIYMPFKLEWLNKNISQYCLYGFFKK